MRKSKIIIWNNKEVTVKELTVAEMASLMAGYQSAQVDMILGADVPAQAVTLATGIEAEELEQCTPSALQPLFDAVQELNPTLARLLTQLKSMVETKLVQHLEE